MNRAHDHARCVSQAVETATELCGKSGERLTAIRKRVLELVWSSHRPIGAYAILDRLREDGRRAAPPTVYRALDFLLAQGLVHRVQSLNAFIGCGQPERDHRAQLLICRGCGSAAELEDSTLDRAVASSARKLGFEVETPVVEVVGLCKGCARGKHDGPSRATH